MANDERQSETFIREVDEELRREQLKALWDRFGVAFIGICVLIVVVVAGYRGWVWWQERQAATAGDRFVAALRTIEDGDRDAGEAELRTIMDEEGPGYAALARLQLAGEQVEAGEQEEALAAFDAIAADASLAQSLRDAARIKAALLALDMGDSDGAVERAGPLDATGNPWRHEAREILGMAAYQAGDLSTARDYFSAMQVDAETPIGIWQRAGVMNALIDGKLSADGTVPTPPEQPAETPVEEQPAMAEEPPAMAEEPPAMAEEPPAMAEEPPAMAEEPPAMAEEPPAMAEEPAPQGGETLPVPAEEEPASGGGETLPVPEGALPLELLPAEGGMGSGGQ